MVSVKLSLLLLFTSVTVQAKQRIAQPPVAEVEYETHVQWGQGFDLQAFDWRSTPFDFTVEPEIAQENATLSTEYKKEVVKSQSEMSEKMRATASISVDGQSAKVKADFSYDSSSSFSASDALFIMHAEKQFGFKGWKRPLPFTEEAKKALCKRFGKEDDDTCQEYTVCEGGSCHGERAPVGWFDHGSCCLTTRQEKAIRHADWRHTNGRTPGFTSQDVYEPCGKAAARVDYEAFQELYGTHYVSGDRYAVSLDVYVKLSTQTTNSDMKIDASLEASFSGYGGVDAAGSASFEMGISNRAKEDRVTVWAESKGTERRFLPDVDVDNLDAVVDDWKNNSNEGTGMAHVLLRYDDHPQYHEVVANCIVEGDIFSPEDQWKNKCVDVAIWNKLVADDIIERQPTECARGVAEQAFTEYERLLNLAENEFTREEYLTALQKTEELVGTWDALANTCKNEAEWCEYQYWDALEELERVQLDIVDSKRACEQNPECKAITCDTEGNVCTLRGSSTLVPSQTMLITYVKAKYCEDFGRYFKEGECLTRHSSSDPVPTGEDAAPGEGAAPGRVELGEVDNITACMGLCLKSKPFTACSFLMGEKKNGKGSCYRETNPITGRSLSNKSRCLFRANNLLHGGENCGWGYRCERDSDGEDNKNQYCNWCGSGKCCKHGEAAGACEGKEGVVAPDGSDSAEALEGYHRCVPGTWEWEDDRWHGEEQITVAPGVQVVGGGHQYERDYVVRVREEDSSDSSDSLSGAVGDAVGDAVGTVLGDTVGDAVGDTIDTVGGVIEDGVEAVGDFFEDAGEAVGDFFEDVFTGRRRVGGQRRRVSERRRINLENPVAKRLERLSRQ